MRLKPFSLLSLSACSVVLLSPLANAADAVAAAYPPPGLYRIDSDAPTKQNGGDQILQHLIQDGVTGKAQITGHSAHTAESSKEFAGTGPTTYCMPALAAGGALPVKSGCKASRGAPGEHSINYITVCGGMKLATTITRVDEKTWVYKTVSAQSSAPMTGGPNYAGMAVVLVDQAAHGATAEERAKAKSQLSQIGEMQTLMKEASDKRAAGAAKLGLKGGAAMASTSGKPLTERTSVHRLTRIGASCGSTVEH